MKKNIIFFLNTEKKISGGRKIIYQFSSFINSQKNFNSSICLIEKKKINKLINSLKKKLKIESLNTGWSFNNLKISKKKDLNYNIKNIHYKKNLVFDKNKDFVILPEIFAHFASEFLIQNKISYAIFVQNGYAIFPTNNFKKLNLAYKNAKFILSYSKDIDTCVSNAFPYCKNKIIKIIPSINSKKLTPNKKKKNLITYMPRKLAKHSELVLFFLRRYIPKSWKIKAINNLSEIKTYDLLKKSKIFMSFSELEGLGIPPIEAALAGNKVIGYTGEAGKEYWRKPTFIEIKNGEIKNFCKKVIESIKKDKINNSSNIRKKLANKYSVLNQKKSIQNFLMKI